MYLEQYTDSEFEKIVELRRKWLNCYADAKKRFALACEIDEIEYKDYSVEERHRIRNRKHQMANYIKVQIACPGLEVSKDDFITEDNIVQNRPQKILFGSMELANVAATLCKEFRNQKIEAYCIDFFNHPFKYASDLSRSRHELYQEKLSMLSFVSEVISEFDVFNIFMHTLLYNIDMPVYRELDKKVVVHYHGQEARLYTLAARKNNFLALLEHTYFVKGLKNDLNNLHYIFLFSNYAHAAVSYFNEFADQLKLAFTVYYEMPQPIALADFENQEGCNKEGAEKFSIVHAPSNTDIKGSRYIADAVDALKENYEIEYVSLNRVPHDEVKAAIANADLIVDQLILGWHGIFALEAMAMGKPVVCYLCEGFFEQSHVKDIPIINADIYNLKDKIEWALSNRDKLEELGKKGHEYVKTNHDAKKIAMLLLEAYEHIPIQKPSHIKLITREDSQSIDEIKAGLLYMSAMRKNFGEFFCMNGHRSIGLYGNNEMLGHAKALINLGGSFMAEVGEFVPDGECGFDAIILMMETDINESFDIAQKKCPAALIVTLSELILLAV